jgi:hypothetical protein
MLTQYKIIVSNDVDKFTAQVLAASKLGLQPIGGISVDTVTDKKGNTLTVFYQAVGK